LRERRQVSHRNNLCKLDASDPFSALIRINQGKGSDHQHCKLSGQHTHTSAAVPIPAEKHPCVNANIRASKFPFDFAISRTHQPWPRYTLKRVLNAAFVDTYPRSNAGILDRTGQHGSTQQWVFLPRMRHICMAESHQLNTRPTWILGRHSEPVSSDSRLSLTDIVYRSVSESTSRDTR
jgi:hypothetical protein